jgi:H+/gluconate symporter-like permease
VWYAQWLGKKYPNFTGNIVPEEDLKEVQENYLRDKEAQTLPSLTLSLLPILVPILLIFCKAIVSTVAKLPGNEGMEEQTIVQVVYFFGNPIIALACSTLLAVYTLVPNLDRAATLGRLEEGLQSAGIILMVTGAGGALGAVVRESGAGNQLAEQVAGLPISPVMIPFIVATLVRLIQGSGTVAMITAASISAPILAQIPGVNMLLAAQAAAIGAMFFSYFNDSLFWVVNRLMGIVDVRQQMAAWSVATTVMWTIGGICIALLNLLIGVDGTLLDPLFPLVIGGAIVAVGRR